MDQKVLIILGHSDKNSFCGHLAASYGKGALSVGAIVKEVFVSDLNFDPILRAGYKSKQKVEDDLLRSQELIKWADHLVFVYPTWWGTMPAILKGFIDRVFLPGFAFKYRPNSIWWDKLLVGRSAHLIVTMDTPPWYFKWFYGSPGHRAMKKMTLEFCGIRPVRISSIGPIKSASPAVLEDWAIKVRRAGEKLL
jgi:NAD(P)H dehydrogenase (quinone)